MYVTTICKPATDGSYATGSPGPWNIPFKVYLKNFVPASEKALAAASTKSKTLALPSEPQIEVTYADVVKIDLRS